MADDGHSGAGEGEDVCTFLASFINQRLQMERLINWLRESQTACTDSNCFDDINGLPGTEQGSWLMSGDEDAYYQAGEDQGPIAMVMCLILGLLTVYAMSLGRNRQNDEPLVAKPAKSPKGGRGPPPDGDDHGQYRRGDDDDQARPML